jgi:uncharacterized protein (DUF427 family)
MSLTAGTGPFGKRPAGRFNFEPQPPGAAVFWEPVATRVRGLLADEVVVDSRAAYLLHETGHLPVYYFPAGDVQADILVPSSTGSTCPYKGDASYYSLQVGDRFVADAVWEYRAPIEPVSFISGYRALYWNRLDEWFVEGQRAVAHPRDPYHRIDVYDSRQHIRVLLDGQCLAESNRAKGLFETGLPPRWYLPAEDVRVDLLEPSQTVTRCAYKGEPAHFHALGHKDVAWTYRDPLWDGERVRDLIAFYNERVDLEVDGQPVERSLTQWSR